MRTVLHGGTILCMDAQHTRGTAVSIEDGRIAEVGDDRMAGRPEGADMIDLQGKTVCPGFIDAHHHISLAAWYQRGVNLHGCRSRKEAFTRIASFAATNPRGSWVYAYNYAPRHLSGGGLSRNDLDSAAQGQSVLVMHHSFHEAMVSSQGLEVAGIDRRTADPYGGRIVRDRDGEPTGELLETAAGPVEAIARSAAAGTGYQDWVEALERYSQTLLAAGITYVCDPGVDGMLESYLRRASAEGRLPVPVSPLFVSREGLFVPPNDRLEGPATKERLGSLEVGALKLFADGGSRCAVCVGLREALGGLVALVGRATRLRRPALLFGALAQGHPRVGRDGCLRMGYLHYEQHELLELCKQAEARGFQLAIHAACNAGIDMALKAYEGIPSGRYRRRVEHLVSLDRAQALRLAQQGAVGVVQPSYVQFFGDEWEALPSPRRLHSVALRDLLDAGVTLAGSSDAPVAPYQPLLGMQAAVTRRTHGGLVHQNEQAITPLEALGLWTTGSAVAANQEGKMGVIRPGANADLVVLSGNPLETPPEKIGSIAVDRTMIAGKSVFSRKLEADRRATHSS